MYFCARFCESMKENDRNTDFFCSKLYDWYEVNARQLPWRQTRNPYLIWLSEVILQQTQVVQGLAYYHAFVENYPTVADLASAPLDDVLKLWQGLGYYSRARNLHAAAQMVMERFDGEFPRKYTDLLQLKGVGAYTAAAIASFSGNEPVAVVDGNVYRFLSRYFRVETPIDSTSGAKEFKELAQYLMPADKAALHNQSMMEFGALQCTPHPHCDQCPFADSCAAFADQVVESLPVKQHKVKIRTRYLHYIYCIADGMLILHHRTNPKDVWQGLYELPLIELDRATDFEELSKKEQFKSLIGDVPFTLVASSKEKTHQLTHQKLVAKCFFLRLKSMPTLLSDDCLAVPLSSLNRFAVPRLVEFFLENGNRIFEAE